MSDLYSVAASDLQKFIAAAIERGDMLMVAVGNEDRQSIRIRMLGNEKFVAACKGVLNGDFADLVDVAMKGKDGEG